jgi:DNA-binding NtrC family response regulator
METSGCTILVVDDENEALVLMKELFEQNGYRTLTANDGEIALQLVEEEQPDIIVSDIVMPNMDGMTLLKKVKETNPDIAVIMVTANGAIENAVDAMKMGAKDYILKPFRLNEVLTKVQNLARLRMLEIENQALRKEVRKKYNFDKIIGKTPIMTELFQRVEAVAPTPSTVLIRGENGTGKELIAHAIHYNSTRAKGPLVKVNCGVLSEGVLESELFGHVKGAFTGAHRDKMGRFEMAHGGTIFLDEIGDISLNMQVKLLRVIQEKEFERVGGNETIKVDVRIIAATNRNLEEAIAEKKFREDLYYRLNVIPIVVPPLRERKDDIPLLVDHFIKKFNTDFNKSIQGVDEEALQALMAYDWPGNIRELENVLERAIVLSRSDLLTVKDFPETIGVQKRQNNHFSYVEGQQLNELVEEFEKTIIEQALEKYNGNKLRTAEKLGIHRSTFMSKLKKYGIN